jgi:hypothetical protein
MIREIYVYYCRLCCKKDCKLPIYMLNFLRITEIAKEERNGDVVIKHVKMRKAHRVLTPPPL